MTLIQHLYQGIAIDQRDSDGYINLNQMADATSRRIDKWLENQSTKDLIAEFEAQTTLNSGEFMPALLTIEGRVGGTWAHPDIAIVFAQWCNPHFALTVSRWVREWLLIGKRPDQWQLLAMTEYQLKLELLKAKNWSKTVEIALDTHKERRLIRFIEEEKVRKQLELELGDNPDEGDDGGGEIHVSGHTRRSN
jgi:KilA-N domain